MFESILCSTFTSRYVQGLGHFDCTVPIFETVWSDETLHGLRCNLGTYYNAFFLGAIFLLFKDLKEIIIATGHRKFEI